MTSTDECLSTAMSKEMLAVIDFETTGLSPAMGDRATEIAVVLIQGGVIVDRYRA